MKRYHRLRSSEALRRLVRETELSPSHLVMPYFVKEGLSKPQEIRSMPGQFQHTVDSLLKELESCVKAGVPAILLFGIPKHKDEWASRAWAEDGIVQKAVRRIKKAFPELLVIGDVCLCEYMSHGHCGLVIQKQKGQEEYAIDNDRTLELLEKAALSQAQAGADMVAPSDMMDGRVGAIRKALDGANFTELPIMSYAAKYASAFYGPFREAAESAPKFGDRKTYQMDPANSTEALREVAADIEEGADIVVVKPALAYLDVIRRVKETFHVPIAAYNVSGEYAMVKAAAREGWLDEKQIVLEMLLSMKRAGADILITYFAKQTAGWLGQ